MPVICGIASSTKNSLKNMTTRLSGRHSALSPTSQFVYIHQCVTRLLIGVQPFTFYFPRADIHELLSPDLLHQLIKGTFKDHVIAWIEDYICATADSDAEAKRILDDIDRRYVPRRMVIHQVLTMRTCTELLLSRPFRGCASFHMDGTSPSGQAMIRKPL